MVRSVGFAEVLEFDVGDSVRIGGIDIRAVPALHSGRRMPFGPVGPPLGYMIRSDASIYFAGDTDLFPRCSTSRRAWISRSCPLAAGALRSAAATWTRSGQPPR